jgi:hypothetical protein
MYFKDEYYLYSVDEDKKILTLNKEEKFDKDMIRYRIIHHLNENPNDCLEWCKVDNNKDTVGDDIIDFYEMNKKGYPSKVILKGNRTFYKKL